ncbi:MAG: protein phosphatase 2C domain-containing protein [Cyanobacteria bacterium P01_D01_bin.156]
MINCPNPECQIANPEGSQICRSCQTVIPHRYLWVVGPSKFDNLDKRYSWKQGQVVVDTQPGLSPPESPDPLPAAVLPYLALACHSVHMPQPYGLYGELLLLDKAPLVTHDATPRLLPTLSEAWPTASPLRQLNWLWQIAGLWPHFLTEQVASSLLPGEQLRVDGGLVRLLELSLDAQAPSFKELALAWQLLVPSSHGSIRAFLEDLCHRLLNGEITTPALLRACLDQAIADVSQGYQSNHELAVITHQGPSRKRNEDACYPASGTTQTHRLAPTASAKQKRPLLLVVCDGIGGHEGGDMASRLAISTVQHQLTPLLNQLTEQTIHNPAAVTAALEQAIATANNQISEHNDQGLRHARNRMGTTLVMALVVGVHAYIAHVGDSRAYYVTADSCQQITFDDDVAAREVRLGYGFYADVVQRPGTGALIQALGMGGAAALHINVQHLILDGDGVLLLCSDGLSDYDRVDQFWATQLRPIVLGKTKPARAVNELLQLANIHNGHDNVTVGIVASHSQALNISAIPVASLNTAAATLPPSGPPLVISPPVSPTTAIPKELPAVPVEKKSGSLLWLVSLLAIVTTSTVLTLVFFRDNNPTPSTEPAPSLPATIQENLNQSNQRVGISDDQSAIPTLVPGSYLQVLEPIFLLETLQPSESETQVSGQLMEGAIVQVMTQQELASEETRWIKVKVCRLGRPEQSNVSELPSSNVTQPNVTTLVFGAEGWVSASQLAAGTRNAEVNGCSPESS